MISKIITHPFREGILGLLRHHFAESIVKNFVLSFEAETFSAYSENIWRQLKDRNYILEVRYKKPDGATEYICDVYSWERKARTEAHLLRHITDKVKIGAIGKNWNWNGKRVSTDIVSGKYETPIVKNTRN